MKKSKKSFDTTVFTLSHSSLETQEGCAFKWYLRYIELNFPKRDNEAADFGSLCHLIAENYFGGGQQELTRLFYEYQEKFILTPKYEAKIPIALQRIERFYDAYLANSTKVYREKEFRYAYDEFIDVSGNIDVLYKMGDKWVVADYKTNAEKKKDFSQQFWFYYYLISKVSGKVPKSLTFQCVYLIAGSDKKLEDFVVTEELFPDSIDMAEGRIEAGINRILLRGVDKTKWKKNVTRLCDWCDYKKAGLCDGTC
jgi:predicted RecB family nuclease